MGNEYIKSLSEVKQYMDILPLLVFIIPAYLSNALPVLLGGGMPLDLDRNYYDGRRILGNGKTIQGFVAGVLGGTVVAGIIAFYYQLPFFDDQRTQFLAGFLLSLGTMIGDALGSFMKRRIGMDPGKEFLPDTILFLIVALVLAYPLTDSSAYQPLSLVFMLGITVILHRFTNFIANQTGLKKVPW